MLILFSEQQDVDCWPISIRAKCLYSWKGCCLSSHMCNLQVFLNERACNEHVQGASRILTIPGMMTRLLSSRTSSADEYSFGSSSVLPTHSMTLFFTKTAPFSISLPSSSNVAMQSTFCKATNVLFSDIDPCANARRRVCSHQHFMLNSFYVLQRFVRSRNVVSTSENAWREFCSEVIFIWRATSCEWVCQQCDLFSLNKNYMARSPNERSRLWRAL